MAQAISAAAAKPSTAPRPDRPAKHVALAVDQGIGRRQRTGSRRRADRRTGCPAACRWRRPRPASSGRAAPGTRNRPASGPAAAAAPARPAARSGILAISTPRSPHSSGTERPRRNAASHDGAFGALHALTHCRRRPAVPCGAAAVAAGGASGLRLWRGAAWRGSRGAVRAARRRRRPAASGRRPRPAVGARGRRLLPAAWQKFERLRHPGWRRHRPAARRASRRAIADHRADRQARRQQAAIAGTDRPGRPACSVTVLRQHVQRRRWRCCRRS